MLARNVLERRRELGLLGAIGFTARHLRTMVTAESLVLVGFGVLVGTVAALVAVAPALSERASAFPFGNLSLLLDRGAGHRPAVRAGGGSTRDRGAGRRGDEERVVRSGGSCRPAVKYGAAGLQTRRRVMKKTSEHRSILLVAVVAFTAGVVGVGSQSPTPSWPQWRGPARDGVAQLTTPATWPTTLTKRWEATVGAGHSSPVVAAAVWSCILAKAIAK